MSMTTMILLGKCNLEDILCYLSDLANLDPLEAVEPQRHGCLH
jgi:hypothetical protein